MLKPAIAMILLVACVADPYGDLPAIEVPLGPAAVGAVADFYGVDLAAPSVHFVAEHPVDPDTGHQLLGTTLGCESWVYAAPGQLPGDTALAHELAHCALYLATGDDDPDHRTAGWWGPGGRAQAAQAQLRSLGM